MKNTTRSKYWDCVKGFAILSIVVNHCVNGSNYFVNTYHIPLFFFASAWFYNEQKYGDFPELLFAKRIKSNWPRYVLYSSLITVLHFILQERVLVGLENYTAFGTCYICLTNFLMLDQEKMLAGPLWFVPCFVLASGLWGITVYLGRHIWGGKRKSIIIASISAAFSALGFMLTSNTIEFPYHFQVSFLVQFIFCAAYFARKADNAEKLLKWYIAVPMLAAIIYFAYGCGFEIDLHGSILPAAWSYYLMVFFGIYFVLWLMKLVLHSGVLSSVFEIMGRYSFEIMAWHTIIGRTTDVLVSKMLGKEISNTFIACNFQQLSVLYVIICVIVAVFIGKIYEMLKAKMNGRALMTVH